MYSLDGHISIQSRLLRNFPRWDQTNAVRVELYKLIHKLRQDFHFNPSVRRGLAILSRERDAQNVRSTVVDLVTPWLGVPRAFDSHNLYKPSKKAEVK